MLILMIILASASALVVTLRWQRDRIIVCICPKEILFIESVEERYRVHGRALNAFLKHHNTWIAFITYAVALGVPTVLAYAGLTKIAVTGVGQWSVMAVEVAAILCAVIPLLLIPLMFARFRKWMRVFLREYLNEHGIPICHDCGYCLKTLTGEYCPECGTTFDSLRLNNEGDD